MDADVSTLTDAQLDQILTRAGRLCRCDDAECVADLTQLGDVDVPALVAEIRRVRGALHDEYGILDLGGGLRQAKDEPLPLPAGNAALSVEMRAKGIFGSGSRRPVLLMQRKATGWEEIPDDVTPDDIAPGYSERKTAAAREANT